MARPERSSMPHQSSSSLLGQPVIPASPRSPDTAAADDNTRGGPVGHMQADLARRLGQGVVGVPVNGSFEERAVRFMSVAGGYGALAAGYAGVVFLILR